MPGRLPSPGRIRREFVERLRAALAPRLAYRLLLGRPIDPLGLATWRNALREDPTALLAMINGLVASSEYLDRVRRDPHVGRMVLDHLHRERTLLVRSLPGARRIVDLGGAVPEDPAGSLLRMGYPHHFDRLTIIDVEPGESLEQRTASRHVSHQHAQGWIEYLYGDMRVLDGEEAAHSVPDASVDLVWMGQSIEHIPEDGADEVLEWVRRKLRPGGELWLDTPNRRVTALESPDRFSHPDHKIEYSADSLARKVAAAGLEVIATEGIGLASEALAAGIHDPGELVVRMARNDRPADSLVLVVGARRPVADPPAG